LLNVSFSVLNDWNQGLDEPKNGERVIKSYGLKCIVSAEEAFVESVQRKAEGKNLSYFFGILRNIQRERDDGVYRQYCRQR